MKKLTALFCIICLITISACAETTSSTSTFWTRNYDGSSNSSPFHIALTGNVSADLTNYVTLTGTQTLTNKSFGSNVDFNSLYGIDHIAFLNLYTGAVIRSASTGLGNYIYVEAYDTDASSYKEIARIITSTNPSFCIGGSQQFTFNQDGSSLINAALTFHEISTPTGPGTDNAKIYAEVGGDNLTDMKVKFQDGTVIIFAEETTPLTASQFTMASETEVKMIMRKPHPGIVQYGYLFPDGYFQVSKQIEYHDAEKIAANKGCISDKLPPGWEVVNK